jgi:hypothetical protein
LLKTNEISIRCPPIENQVEHRLIFTELSEFPSDKTNSCITATGITGDQSFASTMSLYHGLALKSDLSTWRWQDNRLACCRHYCMLRLSGSHPTFVSNGATAPCRRRPPANLNPGICGEKTEGWLSCDGALIDGSSAEPRQASAELSPKELARNLASEVRRRRTKAESKSLLSHNICILRRQASDISRATW